MATNIIANLTDDITLVITGRLHTQVEPIIFDDEKEVHHPMGENVKKQIPNVPSGEIKYLSRQFHNYGTRNLRENPAGVKFQKARFYKSDDGIYLFELPEAHTAIVPNPSEVLPDENEN